MKLFYIPFIYSYQTRFLTPLKFLSWFFIYLFPLLLITALTVIKFDAYSVIAFLLVVLNTYNLYEVGYIYNDTATIKKELNPTLRLSELQLNYFLAKKREVYASRILLSVLIIGLLSIYFSGTVEIQKIIAISLVLSLVFFLYNSVRSRVNLPLHFILVVCRFALVPYVFYPAINVVDLLTLTIFLFPIPNLIERAGEKRFSLTFFQNRFFLNRAVFRDLYYFIGMVVVIAMTGDIRDVSSILFIYFFAYRFFSSQLVPLNKQ
jgi:hypothetical protein